MFETFLQEYAVFRISKYVDQSGSIEKMEESEEAMPPADDRALVKQQVRAVPCLALACVDWDERSLPFSAKQYGIAQIARARLPCSYNIQT